MFFNYKTGENRVSRCWYSHESVFKTSKFIRFNWTNIFFSFWVMWICKLWIWSWFIIIIIFSWKVYIYIYELIKKKTRVTIYSYTLSPKVLRPLEYSLEWSFLFLFIFVLVNIASVPMHFEPTSHNTNPVPLWMLL